MDEILIRFPVVGQIILKQLDDKNLVKCRKVSRIWRSFLDNDSLLWRRRIKKYTKNQIEFYEIWNLVTKKVSVHILKDLAMAVEEFFTLYPTRLENQYSPLHIVAERGNFLLCKYVIGKSNF